MTGRAKRESIRPVRRALVRGALLGVVLAAGAVAAGIASAAPLSTRVAFCPEVRVAANGDVVFRLS